MRPEGEKSILDWMIRGAFFLLLVLVPLFFSLQLTTYTLPKVVLAQVLVCLIFAFCFLKMTLLGRFSFNRSMLLVPVLVYFIIAASSLILGISLPGGLTLLWQVFAYVLVYFIVINHVQERDEETCVLVMSLAGILVSSYGILQYFGVEPLLGGYDYIPYIPFSTLGHRNQAAQYLILLIPLSGTFLFLSPSWVKRVILGIATVMMIYHLYITRSRGAFLGFLLSLLVFLGIVIYKWVEKHPVSRRRKWLFLFLLLLLTPFLFFTFPTVLTLKAKHINPVGYYIHSIDGSKIPANQSIQIQFDYRVLQGDPQKSGFVNLFGERTNSAPIYLIQGGEEWRHAEGREIQFSRTPYEEEIKLRWVPGSEGSAVQLRNISVQTGEGVNLVKDAFLNRFFSKLGVTEVDKVLSSQARLYMYRNTIGMIRDNFFLGVGFGNFKYVYPCYRDRAEWTLSGLNTRVEQAHSEFLQIFSEVGLVGFLAFLWILVRMGQLSFWGIRNAHLGRPFFVHAALTVAILATLAQSLFDFNLQNPASGVTFWTVIGLLEVNYRSVMPSSSIPLRFTLVSKGLRWMLCTGILVCLGAGLFFSFRPVVGDFYLKKGRSYLEARDWGNASLNFKKGGCFSPHNFDIYFHLGQTSDQMKDYDGAVNSYLKAISLHPYFIEARNNLGAVYIKLGLLDEAIEEFRRAIEINPYHPGLHNNLGYLYSKRNLLQEAVEEYRKTLELDHENAEVYKNLGLLYFYKLKDYEKAQKYWEKYLALNPSDPQRDAIRHRIEEIKMGTIKSSSGE